MEHESVAIQNVKDLQTRERQWLEGMLGRHLQENQQVFIMVFTPGALPDEVTRQRARAGLEKTWEQVDRHMKEHGITDEEFDAAVDEAMEHVRRREP